MLHHEALRQLTHDRQRQRRRAAEAERLAREARARQQQRRWLTLDAALGFRHRRRHAQGHGA